VRVERAAVANQVLDAVAVGDQQGLCGEAANVFLALQDQFRFPAIGDDRPGAWRRVAGDFDDAFDDRHEFAAGEFAFDQLAPLGIKVGERIDPGQFVAVRIDQRDAFVRRADREGAYRQGFVRLAIAAGEDQFSECVAVKLEIMRCAHSRSPLSSSPPASRSEPPSVSTLRACA
jgi:hypothetical protein